MGVRENWRASQVRWRTHCQLLLGPEMIPDSSVIRILWRQLHFSSATYPLYTPTDLPGLQQRISKLHPERKYDFEISPAIFH
jgi:hypothetical protein